MAVEDFGGKVLGKPIDVVVADHQNKPGHRFGIGRRKWFDVDKVDMIANLINSSSRSPCAARKGEEPDRHHQRLGSIAPDNDACTPNSIHYAYDTYALARGPERAVEGWPEKLVLPHGGYAFGQRSGSGQPPQSSRRLREVVGSTRYPIETSTSLLSCFRRKASKAKVVALAGSGNVLVNAIKSAQNRNPERRTNAGGAARLD